MAGTKEALARPGGIPHLFSSRWSGNDGVCAGLVEGVRFVKLAAQIRLAPGASVAERAAALAEAGFEAAELHTDAADRVAEYRQALRGAGLPALSMCPAGSDLDLVADEYSQRRRVERTRSILDACQELGVRTLISVPVRGPLPAGVAPEDEIDSYVRALELLAPHAEASGASIAVEPLNRYETHLVNTLADAAAIAARVQSPGVRILADVFHMNIEEDDLGASIRAAGAWIAHVHLADNQRAQPGAGTLDFGAVFAALRGVGYAGSAALECRLRGEPAAALRRSAAHLRAARG